MSVKDILILIGIAVVVIALAKLFGFSFKKIIGLIVNAIIGFVILYVINYFNIIHIPMNIITYLVAGVCGAPGVILLIILAYLGVI